MMKIEVELINEWGKKTDLSKKDAERVLEQTLVCTDFSRRFRGEKVTVTVHLVSDRKIRSLNKQRRKIDKPTDVLSFPLLMWQEGIDYPEIELGDIFLAPDFISRKPEAAADNRSGGSRSSTTATATAYKKHLTFLLVHGFLHLLDYDHETDQQEKEMQKKEKKILMKYAV